MTGEQEHFSQTSGEPIDRVTALTIIEKAIDQNGHEPPHADPERLDLSEFTSMVSVFQPRDLDGRYFDDEKHIKTLQDALGKRENPSYLDPITVWWGGDRYYVIDGHHRRIAYQRAGVHKAIPVKLFRGSLYQAIAFSASSNSKDKLPMSKDDKLNRAWFLLTYTDRSRSEVTKACAVSTGTVNNMRATLKALRERGVPEEELLELSWKDAKDMEQDREKPSVDYDAALQKRADDYRKRLYKAFGNRIHTDTEAFAKALLEGDHRLPMSLMETACWAESFETLVSQRADELVSARKLMQLMDEESDY